MTPESNHTGTLQKIVVRLDVVDDRTAASDDPLFLGLRGPAGREFRLAFRRGRSLRRGAADRFVIGGPNDAETNIDRPELNDPTAPPIDLSGITSVFLRKGLEPIPNVRGHGEMDDRLGVAAIAVELHAAGRQHPLRYARKGPLWLGLVCGLTVELASQDDGG